MLVQSVRDLLAKQQVRTKISELAKPLTQPPLGMGYDLLNVS